MTLTDRSMEWLNQNRFRSYPMRRDEWREKVPRETGLDCLILDAMVFDPGASGGESLELVSVEVVGDQGSDSPGSSSSSDSSSADAAEGYTKIDMRYGGRDFSVTLRGGEDSGMESFSSFRGMIPGAEHGGASVSLVFSSHRYVLNAVGPGRFSIGCKALESRVASLSGGIGVDGISTNGSSGVAGHYGSSVANGDVVLEDGYRTSPVVRGGNVLVRVGKRYGYDPCRFDYGEDGRADCRKPLFFFCGQNAINGGNIVLSGGKGISVAQGRSYSVRSGSCQGKTIPCVEIIAGTELHDICSAGKQAS